MWVITVAYSKRYRGLMVNFNNYFSATHKQMLQNNSILTSLMIQDPLITNIIKIQSASD